METGVSFRVFCALRWQSDAIDARKKIVKPRCTDSPDTQIGHREFDAELVLGDLSYKTSCPQSTQTEGNVDQEGRNGT